MRVLTTRGAAVRGEPDLASGTPDRFERPPADPPPADPPSALPGGVELTRLIALARLTAPQAVEIAAGVLAEAAKRAQPDTGTPGSDPVTIERVVIGADGRVVLGPAADGGHDGQPSAAGPAVAAVLAVVAGAARLRARRADPAAEQ